VLFGLVQCVGLIWIDVVTGYNDVDLDQALAHAF